MKTAAELMFFDPLPKRFPHCLADVLEECTQLELRLASLLDSSPLPLEPDVRTVECFVMETYEAAWASQQDLLDS
ncbi:MAG: hypothetical protein WB621_20475 [Candidatus Acidiferrales bacterium]